MNLSREQVLERINEVRNNVNNDFRPFSGRVADFFDRVENKIPKKLETTLAAIVAATASLGGTGIPKLDTIVYGSVVCGILLGASKSAVKSVLNSLSVKAYEESSDKIVSAFEAEIDKIKQTSSAQDFNTIHDYSKILVLGDYKRKLIGDKNKMSKNGEDAMNSTKIGLSRIFMDGNQDEVIFTFAKKARPHRDSSLSL